MRKLLLTGTTIASLALAGCQSTLNQINAANASLAQVANNDLPTACAVVAVAEGYYANVQSLIPAKTQAVEAKAAAVVNSICANPPTNITSALITLGSAWITIQASTTVPGA